MIDAYFKSRPPYITEFQTPKYQLNIKVCSNDPKVEEFYQNFSSHHLSQQNY